MARPLTYIHERGEWPHFKWDSASLAPALAALRHQQGRLLGRMESLGFPMQQEAALQALTDEVVKSSDIEGETLDEAEVRSSLARRLGLEAGGLGAGNRRVDGVVEMMLDATRNYAAPLTTERLCEWHRLLFPAGRRMPRIRIVGGWRDDADGPMEVVSGPIGRERIHFEAPPAPRVATEMARFLEWFNAVEADGEMDAVLKAALAHLWFVTVHPFEDGNGRIGRAVADLQLARSERSDRRFYSMSAQIRIERTDYYDILERTQKGTLDVTSWMAWFLGCLGRAIAGADAAREAVLRKGRFWHEVHDIHVNARQREMLNRLLDGFDGALTSSKWATLTHASQDTANRDIADLLEKGLLVRNPGGGRSTSYRLRD